MATTTHTKITDVLSPMMFLKNEKFCAEVSVDFTQLNESSNAVGASIGDVVQVVPTLKGLLVTDVTCRVDKPTGNTGHVDIGDVSDANGYNDAYEPSAAVGAMEKSLEATDPYGVGRLYTSNDLTINLSILTSTIVSGTFTMIVEGVVLETYA